MLNMHDVGTVPGKGIVEGVEEEGVMAMRTSDPAHSRHLEERYFIP